MSRMCKVGAIYLLGTAESVAEHCHATVTCRHTTLQEHHESITSTIGLVESGERWPSKHRVQAAAAGKQRPNDGCNACCTQDYARLGTHARRTRASRRAVHTSYVRIWARTQRA